MMLRLAVEGDAADIAAVYRPIVEATAISFETEAPDDGEMRRRIRDTMPLYPWLVCEWDGRVAGYAYATRFRTRAAYQWSVETSAYVDAGFRNRGIGRGLYLSLFAIVAAQGYVNAFAGIALPNAASVALHEAVGFTPAGVYRHVGYKLGQWHDVGWWQREIRAKAAAPVRIEQLNVLESRSDWPALIATGMSAIRTRG